MFDKRNSDKSVFTDFEKHIQNSLQDTIDKFEKSF